MDTQSIGNAYRHRQDMASRPGIGPRRCSTASLDRNAVLTHTDALRAEFKKDPAEFELRLNPWLSALERLEEQRGLVRP